MIGRLLVAGILCASLALAADGPWAKPPDRWTESDVIRILRDSPWSPAKVSIETEYRQRRTDPLTGVPSDSPDHVQGSVVRDIVVSRALRLKEVTVLWWSSRTIRLAEEKRLESRIGAAAKGAIGTAALPDYVLVVEGHEPLRILRDAREDLRDTVFLELENGGTLDFTAVNFVDHTEAETLRTEFHFPRSLEGQPSIYPEAARVVFHCRATAKKEIPGRNNSLSLRVEFRPRAMKAQGQPDL
jgi:hypothetical protein